MYQDEHHDNVDAAIEMLLEEIETVVDLVNRQGAAAFQKGNLDDVRRLTDEASKAQAFLTKARDLQREWTDLLPREKEPNRPASEPLPQPENHRKHLRHGLRTPVSAFYVPILRVLVKMGGTGQSSDVINRVGEQMKPNFNEYDLEKMPAPPHEQRWIKTANWARWYMVKERLLSSDSARGVWEITEAGKQFLAARTRV